MEKLFALDRNMDIMLYMGVTFLVIAISLQMAAHRQKKAVQIPPGEPGPVLYKLASEGKEQEVRAMLSTGLLDCVRFVDPGSGASPLWIASAKGHLGIVSALAEASADMNWPNKNGASPLFVASQQGELEVVQALLVASAEVDGAVALSVNVDGATALSVASQEGHLDVVKALLAASAEVDWSKNDGATPLFMASGLGQVDVVKVLLEASADVDRLTHQGVTPLFMASGNGRYEVVRVLLASGADRGIRWVAPSGMEYTPLSEAEQKGHLAVAALLRADPNDLYRPASF